MTALSHMEALNTRLAAEQPVVPLRLPVTADEWTCHASTTVRDAAGEVLAECSGHGRHSVEDEAIAAEIVRRVNVHEELLAAAKAGKAYRDALAQCANDPERMASFCTAEGDDLDALFAAWERLSDAAIAKATGGGA